MSAVVNEIAKAKGWSYDKRSSKWEREFGYRFKCGAYVQQVRADNPVDAANRLQPANEVKRKFRKAHKTLRRAIEQPC